MIQGYRFLAHLWLHEIIVHEAVWNISSQISCISRISQLRCYYTNMQNFNKIWSTYMIKCSQELWKLYQYAYINNFTLFPLLYRRLNTCSEIWHARIQRGGGLGGPDPLKNHQNIGFLSNTSPSQSYQVSNQCSAIIGTPAKRHLNGVSLAGSWWPAHSGIWILLLLINLKKKQKKTSKLDRRPLTKLSWSAPVWRYPRDEFPVAVG